MRLLLMLIVLTWGCDTDSESETVDCDEQADGCCQDIGLWSAELGGCGMVISADPAENAENVVFAGWCACLEDAGCTDDYCSEAGY